MSHPQPNRSGPLAVFYELFEDRLSADDYVQFYSNQRKKGKDTYLMSDLFTADKLADVILEEYGVRDKLQGNVIVIYPQPAFDVPIFTFQLGGNATQKIALLDISPTHGDLDYAPLIPVFEKYRDLLDIQPSKLDWVNSICSPYLLHRQYEALDVDLFTAALREYLAIWIEQYYVPARELARESAVDEAREAIRRYKQILHDNDPAYGIFARAWGKPVADAFYYLETRSEPALAMPPQSGAPASRGA